MKPIDEISNEILDCPEDEPISFFGFCQSCGKFKSISPNTTPSFICGSCYGEILDSYVEV